MPQWSRVNAREANLLAFDGKASGQVLLESKEKQVDIFPQFDQFEFVFSTIQSVFLISLSLCFFPFKTKKLKVITREAPYIKGALPTALWFSF